MIENDTLKSIEEDYLKSLKELEVLDDINLYLDDIRKGDIELMKKLVNTYIVQIPSIAVKYVDEDLDIAYMDLIEEANCCLLEKTEQYFKENNNEDFHDYIINNIEDAINNFIESEETYVTLPQEQINLMIKISEKIDELTVKLKRKPNFKEVKECFKDVDDNNISLVIELKNGKVI